MSEERVHLRTIAIPAELHEEASRAAKDAGYPGIEALVISRLRTFVEYGDFASADGPAKADRTWTPVPL